MPFSTNHKIADLLKHRDFFVICWSSGWIPSQLSYKCTLVRRLEVLGLHVKQHCSALCMVCCSTKKFETSNVLRRKYLIKNFHFDWIKWQQFEDFINMSCSWRSFSLLSLMYRTTFYWSYLQKFVGSNTYLKENMYCKIMYISREYLILIYYVRLFRTI